MKSIQQKALQFIYIVRQRFINQRPKFDEFVSVITSVKVEQNHAHVISKLESLFAVDHPDLLYGLNEFLPKKYEASVVSLEHDDDDKTKEDHPPKKKQCTRKYASWVLRESPRELYDKIRDGCIEMNDDEFSVNVMKYLETVLSSPSEIFNKIRDRCIEKNDDEFSVLNKFRETVRSYDDKKITFYQADTVFKKLFKDDPDLFLESNSVLAMSLEAPSKISGYTGQEISGNVVCSLHEETMDVKEFYLFEMDLNFSRLESTIKKLEKDPESLEEGFTALDFRCIKKLYDDSDETHDGLGEEMVEILKSDPVGGVVARVVVLEQLREKKRQLEEQKLHLDKIWNEIFEDIREKGCVRRHREFLRRTKEASINGFGKKK